MQLACPPHPATLEPGDLRDSCVIRRLRRSGPGGQHRNKVETAVVVTHEPTGVTAEASERRSQAQNLQVALRRLRVRLAVHVRLSAGAVAAEYPSRRWRDRVRSGQLAVNASHDDHPAILAEALDVVAANGWDDAAAAGALGVCRTQLVRFLKTERAAFERLNSERRTRGLPRLR